MKSKRRKKIVLEPGKRTTQVLEFEHELQHKVVGQKEAVSTLVTAYQAVLAGMAPDDRPIANLLFLGPTGSGKTRTVEAAAEILFGSPRAVVKIDCGEYQHGHEIAKLIGSPPGYIGHNETQPMLTQSALDQFHTDDLRMTFVLFDEIEKASDSVWRLLLGVLDKATLTLGDNRKVDFSRTVIVMTSNLGAAEMSRLLGGGIGFTSSNEALGADVNRKLSGVAIEAAKARFSPEFMNRIDRTVVFQTLTEPELVDILELELSTVQRRLMSAQRNRAFVLRCERKVKTFLIKEGTDPKYGARPLKRAIDRHLVQPLTCLISTEQINLGDVVNVSMGRDGQSLVFTKDGVTPFMPAPIPSPERLIIHYSAGA